MKKTRIFFLGIIWMLSGIAGAGDLVVDATTSESYRRTTIDIRRSLGPAEAAKFFSACYRLIDKAKNEEPVGTPQNLLVQKALHGKSAVEIISEAFSP